MIKIVSAAEILCPLGVYIGILLISNDVSVTERCPYYGQNFVYHYCLVSICTSFSNLATTKSTLNIETA